MTILSSADGLTVFSAFQLILLIRNNEVPEKRKILFRPTRSERSLALVVILEVFQYVSTFGFYGFFDVKLWFSKCVFLLLLLFILFSSGGTLFSN